MDKLEALTARMDKFEYNKDQDKKISTCITEGGKESSMAKPLKRKDIMVLKGPQTTRLTKKQVI